jgi:hypothetical protein
LAQAIQHIQLDTIGVFVMTLINSEITNYAIVIVPNTVRNLDQIMVLFEGYTQDIIEDNSTIIAIPQNILNDNSTIITVPRDILNDNSTIITVPRNINWGMYF